MSDHLVAPPALARLMTAQSDQNLLLVDPRVDGVFDLPDATKVMLEETRITGIGKELADFNAIDCGVFRLDERFFEAMGAPSAREGEHQRGRPPPDRGPRRSVECFCRKAATGSISTRRRPTSTRWRTSGGTCKAKCEVWMSKIRLLFKMGFVYHKAAFDPVIELFRQDERYDVYFSLEEERIRRFFVNVRYRTPLIAEWERQGYRFTKERGASISSSWGTRSGTPRSTGTLCSAS